MEASGAAERPRGRDDSAAGAAARLAPIASLSRRESVMREIRRAIVLGDLGPGQRLTENALAEALNVSRPTVREALSQLVTEGFLVSEPYRGIRVSTLSAREMEDAARVRIALDVLAAEMILEDESGDRLERVREAFADYERDIADEDALARHDAHVRFHRRLWEATDNRMLERSWPVTEAQIVLQLAVDQRLASDAGRDVGLHRRIVEALEAAARGDRSDLVPALEEHIWGSVRDLSAEF